MSAEPMICGCMGPQNGEPLCPCQMRGVEIINGRYVKTIDYGPAPTPAQQAQIKAWRLQNGVALQQMLQKFVDGVSK